VKDSTAAEVMNSCQLRDLAVRASYEYPASRCAVSQWEKFSVEDSYPLHNILQYYFSGERD
jgi:hypothetical protein